MDLKDIQNHENPNKEYYQELIAYLKNIKSIDTFREPYAQNWSLHRAINDIFKNKLKDKILVDLGCGQYIQQNAVNPNSYIIKLAREFQVKSYIGIDKFIQLDDLERFNSQKSLDAVIIKADMLDFVSKLPDNSVNFTINGIDFLVIGCSLRYARAVAEEMVRATPLKGIIFGLCSQSTNFLKRHCEEHKLKILYKNSGSYIFEKQ